MCLASLLTKVIGEATTFLSSRMFTTRVDIQLKRKSMAMTIHMRNAPPCAHFQTWCVECEEHGWRQTYHAVQRLLAWPNLQRKPHRRSCCSTCRPSVFWSKVHWTCIRSSGCKAYFPFIDDFTWSHTHTLCCLRSNDWSTTRVSVVRHLFRQYLPRWRSWSTPLRMTGSHSKWWISLHLLWCDQDSYSFNMGDLTISANVLFNYIEANKQC